MEGSSYASKQSSFGLYDLVRTPQMRKRTLVSFFLWLVAKFLPSDSLDGQCNKFFNPESVVNKTTLGKDSLRQNCTLATFRVSVFGEKNHVYACPMIRVLSENREKELTFRPVCTMMYYGLTMKSDIGGGSLFLNFALSAAMEIPALLLVYFLIDRIGRRQLVSSGLLTAGICLIANWVIGDGSKSILKQNKLRFQFLSTSPLSKSPLPREQSLSPTQQCTPTPRNFSQLLSETVLLVVALLLHELELYPALTSLCGWFV